LEKDPVFKRIPIVLMIILGIKFQGIIFLPLQSKEIKASWIHWLKYLFQLMVLKIPFSFFHLVNEYSKRRKNVSDQHFS
jgi:hypothetical protein